MFNQRNHPGISITKEDKRLLRADVTDHLKTVPGTERLIGTEEEDGAPIRRQQDRQRVRGGNKDDLVAPDPSTG